MTQAACYQLDVTFPGGGQAPTVSGGLLFGPKTYDPCKLLKTMLREMDQKNGNGPAGKMVDGYNQPRGHQVRIR